MVAIVLVLLVLAQVVGLRGCSCSSTPFLLTKGTAGQRQILNDVMIGNPASFYTSRSAGEQAFANGDIGFDLYPVPLARLANENGTYEFSIKEIEPEVSVIHDLSYGHVTIPQHRKICIDNSHQKLYAVGETNPIREKIYRSNGEQIEDNFVHNIEQTQPDQKTYKDKSVLLKQGEVLNLSIPETEAGSYLSTRRHFD